MMIHTDLASLTCPLFWKHANSGRYSPILWIRPLAKRQPSSVPPAVSYGPVWGGVMNA